jgi:hypothetical protein
VRPSGAAGTGWARIAADDQAVLTARNQLKPAWNTYSPTNLTARDAGAFESTRSYYFAASDLRNGRTSPHSRSTAAQDTRTGRRACGATYGASSACGHGAARARPGGPSSRHDARRSRQLGSRHGNVQARRTSQVTSRRNGAGSGRSR